jgi:hypothetical protein
VTRRNSREFPAAHVRDSHDKDANERERARAYADVAPSAVGVGAGDDAGVGTVGGDVGVGASGVITSKDQKGS